MQNLTLIKPRSFIVYGILFLRTSGCMSVCSSKVCFREDETFFRYFDRICFLCKLNCVSPVTVFSTVVAHYKCIHSFHYSTTITQCDL